MEWEYYFHSILWWTQPRTLCEMAILSPNQRLQSSRMDIGRMNRRPWERWRQREERKERKRRNNKSLCKLFHSIIWSATKTQMRHDKRMNKNGSSSEKIQIYDNHLNPISLLIYIWKLVWYLLFGRIDPRLALTMAYIHCVYHPTNGCARMVNGQQSIPFAKPPDGSEIFPSYSRAFELI